MNGVSGDADGFGYFGYAYFAANKDKLRALAVQSDASKPPVLPSAETIADKSYTPLSRPLYIYVKKSAARRGEVAKFLKFYIDNIDDLAVKAGYDRPTAEDTAANKQTLAALTSSGEARADTSVPTAK